MTTFELNRVQTQTFQRYLKKKPNIFQYMIHFDYVLNWYVLFD
jgi:hypothetical protein